MLHVTNFAVCFTFIVAAPEFIFDMFIEYFTVAYRFTIRPAAPASA